MTIKTASVLIIGNEILSGRTHDKNGNWIAIQLTEAGIQLKEIRVVPDNEDEIIGALNTLKSKYDYVFTTGGIGPTHDDITAECVAKAFGRELIMHRQAYDVLFAHYGKEDFNEARQKMAMMPSGDDVKLIDNPVSAAPGFNIGNVYVMAGVPRIMQSMMDQILPTLQSGDPVLSVTIASPLSEGVIAIALGDLQKEFSEVDIGSYPYFRKGDFGVSVVLRSTNKKRLNEAKDTLEKMLENMNQQIKE